MTTRVTEGVRFVRRTKKKGRLLQLRHYKIEVRKMLLAGPVT